MAREQAAGSAGVYRWHERDYAVPGYYGFGIPHEFEGHVDLQDRLRNAVYTLVLSVGAKAPETTLPYANMKHAKDWPKNPVQWPHVLQSGEKGRYEWGVLVTLPPAVREAIDRLDQEIRLVLPAAYTAGKEAGASVLMGLARGEVSMDDFDEALLTPAARAERQKAKRGY
jgi:hypothetical protein